MDKVIKNCLHSQKPLQISEEILISYHVFFCVIFVWTDPFNIMFVLDIFLFSQIEELFSLHILNLLIALYVFGSLTT